MTNDQIKNITTESFYHFACISAQLADTHRIEEKIIILKKYLLSCSNDIIKLTLPFLTGEYLQSLKQQKKLIGSQLIGQSASDFLEIDYDLVFRPCRKAMGKTPETVARLLENFDHISDKHSIKNYSISQIWGLLIDFNACKNRTDKLILLEIVWRTMRPVEVRFFLQLLSGRLTVGITTEILLHIFVNTYNLKMDTLRRVYLQTGSLTKTGLMVIEGIDFDKLNDIQPLSSTILTVLLYVKAESRGKVSLFSELTVGIRVDNNVNFDQDYIPIGKINGGISEENIEPLNQLLPNLTIDKFGTTLMLKPEIVVEIEFEQVVKNNRTKAGYSIISPRIVNFHWSKNPIDSHELNYVIDFYKKNDR